MQNNTNKNPLISLWDLYKLLIQKNNIKTIIVIYLLLMVPNLSVSLQSNTELTGLKPDGSTSYANYRLSIYIHCVHPF